MQAFKVKIAPFIFALLLIVINSCSPEEVRPALRAEFDVTYLSEFQNTVYPSFIFGLTEWEKQENKAMDYFTITVNPNIKTNIRVVIEESKLNYETVITLNDIQGEEKLIPSIKWKFDDLKNLRQPGNVDMTFVCFDDDYKEIGRKNLRLSYRAINECVYAGVIDGEIAPLWWMFAAYINEDSPVIDGFLYEVLQNTNLDGFVGYQNGEDGVFEQVAAIFYTLRMKGIKYSSITSTSNSNPNIASQYIRFSDEVLTNTQANCADGTVFFCSVLKKIGIHTEMVFTPGHVYLAYYLNKNKTKSYLLETTMVGSSNYDIYDATNFQVDAFNSNLAKFYNDDFLDGYFVIDVDAARRIIKPIGR